MGASFRFGDYGNPGADRKAAPFFGVALGRGTNQAAVESKDLQERVAFGGCAVHGELIITSDLTFDKGAQPYANSANAAADSRVELVCAKIAKLFSGAQGFEAIPAGGYGRRGRIAMDDVRAQAAAIDLVGFRVGHDQAGTPQQRLES